MFRCPLVFNSGKNAPGFSFGGCTHEFSQEEQQKSSIIFISHLTGTADVQVTGKEFALSGTRRETLMFDVDVRWRMIRNDPFHSPTKVNVLEIAENGNHSPGRRYKCT